MQKFAEVRRRRFVRPRNLRVLAQPFPRIKVFGIKSRHGTDHDGYVIHASSQRAGTILCEGSWHNTGATDQPLRGKHPYEAIVSGWVLKGTTGVGTDARGCEPTGYRGSRTVA